MIHTGFHVARATRDTASPISLSTTGLSPPMVQLSTASSRVLDTCRCPTTPATGVAGLGWSPFARRYLGNRFYFLFLQLLRCFSSLGWLVLPYIFR
jgi:hypothetical protein